MKTPPPLTQLDKLFFRLRNVGLKVKFPTCELGATNVQYLCFRLTLNGILPGVDELKALKYTAVPKNVKEVRQFTGLCNFFRSQINKVCFSSTVSSAEQGFQIEKGPMPDKTLETYETLKNVSVVNQ
jgi:hypothetical protein